MTVRIALPLAVVCLFFGCSLALVAGAGPAETTVVPAGDETQLHDRGAPPGGATDIATLGPIPDAQQPAPLTVPQGPPDTDATVTQIKIHKNGTAVWSLTIRMQLDSDEAETEFEAFKTEFKANRSDFIDSYRAPRVDAVSKAQNLTGREMAATGFRAETGTEAVPREWGYVTYRFTWEGFASVENGTVRTGDVFEGGLFLEENGILVIESPDGYEPATVAPEPDQLENNELRWEGPVSFSDRRPAADFRQPDPPADDGDTTDDTPDDSADDNATDDSTGADGDPPDGADDDAADGGSGDGGLSVGSMLFVTAGVAVLVGVAAFYIHRRRQEPEQKGSPVASDATDRAETAPDTADETESASEMPDLATDEDRVIAALEAEDGRMRQSELADELDWSPSKASRVLSDMADEGDIEKLRIGRENVIDLADDDE